MPYTREVFPGQIVRREHYADVMHVEGTTQTGDGLITITGHSPTGGYAMEACQAATRWIDDVIPDGSTVRYHGSLTPFHGAYAARACTCPECSAAQPGEKFELANGTHHLQHVNRRSITVIVAYCVACATAAAHVS